MNAKPLTAGCICGAISYEIDEVFDAGYCHCTFCRKASGAPVSAVAWVAGDKFRVIKGSPRMRRRSDGNYYSCDECAAGGYLEIPSASHRLARNGRYFAIPIGVLDEPIRVPPLIHLFVQQKLAWLNIVDDLPRVPGNRLPHPTRRSSELQLMREIRFRR